MIKLNPRGETQVKINIAFGRCPASEIFENHNSRGAGLYNHKVTPEISRNELKFKAFSSLECYHTMRFSQFSQ